MKKYLSMLIALMMVAGLMANPAISCAEGDTSYIVKYSEGITGGSISFDKSTGTITDCDESVTAAVISGTIEGVAVESIGDQAFMGCTSLTKVEIPDSVTIIGEYAFDGCSSLTEINIPNGVTSIKHRMFYGCSSLAEIIIPDSVASIESQAFDNCSSLISFSYPEGITSVNFGLFYNCDSLTTVKISKNVTDISLGRSFCYLHNLKEVVVEDGNSNFSSVDGVLLSKDGTELIAYPKGKEDTSYTTPTSVKTIKSEAFMGCKNLKTLIISEGATKLEEKVFGDGNSYHYGGLEHESLTSITIPSSVESIGIPSFSGSRNLTEINVSDSNSHYCSMDGVLFNKAKTELIAYPASKATSEYKVPDGVTSVAQCAFWGNEALTNVEIPETTTVIDRDAFGACSNLEKIVIPKSVTLVGNNSGLLYNDEAFSSCEKLTIHGYTGSYIETHAKNKGIPFVAIDAPAGGSGTSGGTDSESSENADGGNEVTPLPDGGTNTPGENTGAPDSNDGAVEPGYEILKDAAITIGGVEFVVDTKADGTAIISKIGKTNKKTITVKDTMTINGVSYKVTGIDAKAFKDCKNVTKIIISSNVKLIKKNAFAGLKKLKAIHYKGKRSIKINKGAFKGLKTKDMKFTVNKKMNKNELNKFKKSLKKAGFKGTVKRGR